MVLALAGDSTMTSFLELDKHSSELSGVPKGQDTRQFGFVNHSSSFWGPALARVWVEIPTTVTCKVTRTIKP